MSWRYRVVDGRSAERNLTTELDLAYLAAQIVAFKLKIKVPNIRFFEKSVDGYIERAEPIDGYCPSHREIFLRKGLALARVVEVTFHECRHAWQWTQPGYAGRSDHHAEADASTFLREIWQERRGENNREKILIQLCETLAPLAIVAGDQLTAEFCIEELRIAGHPAAARLDKTWAGHPTQVEKEQRVESPHNNVNVTNLLNEIRKNYYEVILPAQAERFLKPHRRVFEGIYP